MEWQETLFPLEGFAAGASVDASSFWNCVIMVGRLFTPADKVSLNHLFQIQGEFSECGKVIFLLNVFPSLFQRKPLQKNAAYLLNNVFVVLILDFVVLSHTSPVFTCDIISEKRNCFGCL